MLVHYAICVARSVCVMMGLSLVSFLFLVILFLVYDDEKKKDLIVVVIKQI